MTVRSKRTSRVPSSSSRARKTNLELFVLWKDNKDCAVSEKGVSSGSQTPRRHCVRLGQHGRDNGPRLRLPTQVGEDQW